MIYKHTFLTMIFFVFALSSTAQVINEEEETEQKKEEKPEKEREKTKEATGTTTRMFQEYQSWSADAMGGLFFPSQAPLLFYSFGVYPRYNFIAPKDYFSISVGSPLNLGFSFTAGSYGTFIQFMGDIPVTVDLNLGSRATLFNESLFGAYVGAGFNYNYMFYQVNDDKATIHTVGPMIHGGFRWEINGRETGFRVSYLSGFPKSTTGQQNVNGEWVTAEDETSQIPGNKIFSISVIYGIK
ncbi:MAG: hypothetical protein ACJAZ2_000164 [Glaciecola sp.]|jgi:hypothetical protein